MTEPEVRTPFGVLLQRYRVAAGLSQEALAERAGLSRRGISDLERGKRRVPHPATARRLADALALDASTRASWLTRTRPRRDAEPRPADTPGGDHASPKAIHRIASDAMPLVGRAVECERLLGAWQTAVSGGPRMVVIAGEAGIGKTRLAEELLAWASGQCIATVRSRAYAAEGWLAYGPVSDWLRDAVFRDSVARLDRRSVEYVAHLVPELARDRASTHSDNGMSEPQNRQQFFSALSRAMLGTNRPLLLLLDDLQWCDQGTLEWLHYLLRFDTTATLLVVGTLRPDEVDRAHPLNTLLTELQHDAQLIELSLGPLDVSAAAALATQAAGHALDVDEVERIFSQTEGHPLFLIETVRARASVQTAPPISEPESMPPRVHAVIAARLSRLSEPARGTVRLAATIGRLFSLDLLVEAHGGNLDELVAPLDELVNRQIVREQGTSGYDFTHDRIREVAYTEMSAARRAMLHRHIAQALERVSAHNLDSASAQIAAQYAQAGLAAQAVPFYQRAAEVAQRVYAHAEAAQLLSRGLTLLGSLPPGRGQDLRELSMQTQLGPSLVSMRGYGGPELLTAYRRAQELSQRLGEPPHPPVLRALAIASIACAEFDRARQLGEQLLEMAARTSDRVLQVEGHYTLGVALFWKGEFTDSRVHLELALAHSRSSFGTDHLSLFAQDPRVVCMSRLAIDLWLLGDVQEANETMERALHLGHELAHPNSLGYAHLFAMMLAALQHDVDIVARHAEACLALSREHTMGLWLSNATVFLGWTRAERGDFAAGLADMRRGIRLFRAGGNVYIMPFFLGLLAQQCARAGRLERALSILTVALAAVERTGERWCAAELLRLRGIAHRSLGDDRNAEVAFQQALTIAQAQQAKTFEARVRLEINRSECSG